MQNPKINVCILCCSNDLDLASRLFECISKQSPNNILIIFDGHPAELPPQGHGFNGANIMVSRPEGDFGSHRNKALEFYAKGEWIVYLDADEMVKPEFLDSIKAIIEHNDNVDCIALARYNTYGDDVWDIPERGTQKPFAYPDYQARVVFNNGIVKYEGKVHEGIASTSKMLTVMRPDTDIIHHKTQEMQERTTNLWNQLQ